MGSDDECGHYRTIRAGKANTVFALTITRTRSYNDKGFHRRFKACRANECAASEAARMENGFPILIGDANGADGLSKNTFTANTMIMSGSFGRNLPKQEIGKPAASQLALADAMRQFYSAKDRVMAQEATIDVGWKECWNPQSLPHGFDLQCTQIRNSVEWLSSSTDVTIEIENSTYLLTLQVDVPGISIS